MIHENNIVAVIDLGTNSFRLVIAKIFGCRYKIIKQEREVIHLRDKSDNLFYKIKEEKIDEAIHILKRFYEISKKHNAKIYAFGTSALRDATNNIKFISLVKEKFDFEIKILSGNEEAQLISYGINFYYDVKDKNILIFDLGGGSTEFVIQKNRNIIFNKSLNIGAVRQTQKWFNDFSFSDENIYNCQKEIDNELNEVFVDNNFEQIFGIGGTINAVTWLIEKNIYNRDHNFKVLPNYVINKNVFIKVKNIILNHALKNELNKNIGIDDQRTKIIVAGILIVDKIFEKINCEKIISPGISIRDSFIIKKFLMKIE